MSAIRRYVLVCAIEGIDTLLCTSDAAGVVAAWSGTDWSKATEGAFIDVLHKQSANPWEPFNGGGQATISTLDDAFGILAHRATGAADSELATSLDRDDTTVTVKDASAFAASGHIYIGNETIGYASRTSTDFLMCERGKFHPIGTHATGLGGDRFAHPHRVETTSYAPPVGPRVTQFPTEWIGRWVAIYRHAYVDGALQDKADATRVFAGRIAEMRDDPETFATVIIVDSALTALKEATVGGDQFTATVADGIYIKSGNYFTAHDWNGTTTRIANDLTVLSSGASGPNEMNEGFYTTAKLHTTIMTWLAAETAAGRLHGTYILVIDQDERVTKVGWEIAGSNQVSFSMQFPDNVAVFMGFHPVIGEIKSGSEWHSTRGTSPPLRVWSPLFAVDDRILVENLSGQFGNQYDTMPVNLKPPVASDAGLFIFDDRLLVSANVTDNLDNTITLSNVRVFWAFGSEDSSTAGVYSKEFDEDGAATIKQVMIFEGAAGTVLNQIMFSTGSAGYNHDTYDMLPFGAGLGWPGGLFGDAWTTSIENMPGGDKPIAVMIDKPMKLSAGIGSDLLLRFAFPVWKSGGLAMSMWQTPSASLAIASLTEDNKAEPTTQTSPNHRTSTLLSDQWRSNQFKIQYNRTVLGDGDYRSVANVEDRTTIDDGGSTRSPRTIDARNTYSEFWGTGTGLEDIVLNVFIPTVTLFTKPVRTLRRSIDQDTAELIVPGSIVKVSDTFARDPDSGERGFSNRPAIVTAVASSQGGAAPGGSVDQIVGDVEVMLMRGNRFYAYAPSAEIASYTSGTKTVTCTAHAYSEASEPADAANFAAGDVVVVHEIDPSDPSTVQSWTDTIKSVSGNDLTLVTGLSGFSTSKRYRVIPAGYASVQTTQQDKAFQADDADGLIEDAAQANTFGLVSSSVAATSSSHTDRPERHADLQFGDGKPFDAGSIVGVQRMIDNLIDHKTALCTPVLGETMSNSTYSSGQKYKTTMVIPVALTTATLSNSVMRYVSVSPWLRSSDGTATHVRISLSDKPPTDSTVDDMIVPSPAAQATWSTSSTTWATGTATTLSLAVKDGNGWGWLIVECEYKAECRGIAKFVELERMNFS